MKKLEIKPGRSASAIGIIMGIMGIVFGIFWIGMILHLSDSSDQGMEPGEVFLLIFGVMFIIVLIGITSFYVKSAFAKKRPSILDIEEGTIEQTNGGASTETGTTPAGEIKFCTYCGKPVKKEFSFCQACGKKIIT